MMEHPQPFGIPFRHVMTLIVCIATICYFIGRLWTMKKEKKQKSKRKYQDSRQRDQLPVIANILKDIDELKEKHVHMNEMKHSLTRQIAEINHVNRQILRRQAIIQQSFGKLDAECDSDTEKCDEFEQLEALMDVLEKELETNQEEQIQHPVTPPTTCIMAPIHALNDIVRKINDYIQKLDQMEQSLLEQSLLESDTKKLHDLEIKAVEKEISDRTETLNKLEHTMNEAIRTTNGTIKNVQAHTIKDTKIKQMQNVLNEIITKYKMIVAERDALFVRIKEMKNESTNNKMETNSKTAEVSNLMANVCTVKGLFEELKQQAKNLITGATQLKNDTCNFMQNENRWAVYAQTEFIQLQKLAKQTGELESKVKMIGAKYEELRGIYHSMTPVVGLPVQELCEK